MNSLLIVGLGNPGKEYEDTRHNAGSDFVRLLCNKYEISLQKEKLIRSHFGKFKINDCSIIICIPDTFMNESGISVAKAKKFFKVSNEEILIVHDELDLINGSIKLKDSGGHGGHNGLRNIIDHLNGDSSFKRLRIGIGHPGIDKDVVSYVLKKAPNQERKELLENMTHCLPIVENLISKGWQQSIMELHTSKEEKDES
ncbi:MAG: aminoacyl-tRNA hydrolase [Gammaproteobacteria bacterium]|nr:aminoacyl-tRNA hydrolase [Gammaproteobacteria bacterium]